MTTTPYIANLWEGWQGRAALAAPPVEQPEAQALIEDLCTRIKAADDAAADGDYMLDSNDCISVLRGTWKGPLAMDKPAQPAAQAEPTYTQAQQHVWMALSEMPCDCSPRRREDGEHLSGCHLFDVVAALNDAFKATPPSPTEQPREDAAEAALRKVLDVTRRYLPPNGPTAREAMGEIIAVVDPWPLGQLKD